MRLIDADLLEKQMDKEVLHLFNSMYKGYVKAMKCVKQQPTAFDIDEVVERLEEVKKRAFELCLATNDSAQRLKYIEKKQTIDLAIEIVKGGGVK